MVNNESDKEKDTADINRDELNKIKLELQRDM